VAFGSYCAIAQALGLQWLFDVIMATPVSNPLVPQHYLTGASALSLAREGEMPALCEAIGAGNKPLVLKSGTALMLCCQIDRFSEDLDFD
jgi:hypothetical protein